MSRKKEPASEHVSDHEHTSRQIKAAERLIAVRAAHDDLIEFCRLMFPDPDDPDDTSKSRYDAQLHHRTIAAALQEVEAGRILRLIITLPPGSGKSEIASKKFIPWVMGRNPYNNFIFATYNDTFAEDFGRSVRTTMKESVFSQVFPDCHLRPGSAAASRLETMEGGISVFVGAEGSITGRRAHIALIDDPIKDDIQASSKTERDKQWTWFTKVLLTRLYNFTSRIIIIQTRWHEDDLIGRLTDPTNDFYSEDEAAKWKILALPALAEKDDPMGREIGESIWPERFPKEYLEGIRNIDPKGFSALFQCRPSPEDGEFFRKQFISTYQLNELPKNLRNYSASDHAVSLEQNRDLTCLIHAGVDESDTLWIYPDLFWKQADTLEVTEAMLTAMAFHHPLFWWAESGHISKSIGPFLRKRMAEDRTYCAILEMTPAKDKRTRAQSIHARMAMGKVKFPAFAPWWGDAMQQLLKFPAVAHDDFVDALSWLGIGLNLHVRAHGLAKQSDILPKPGTLAWIKAQDKYDKELEKAATKDGF